MRGFIIQASYRIQGGAPVVYLFGRLSGGETFLIRDHRQQPHFYIRECDRERAAACGIESAPAVQRTFDGAQASRITVGVPQDAPRVRDRLHALGIDTFEADVRFAMRYLIDRDIRGGCEIEGPRTAGERVDWIYDDPAVSPAEVEFSPTVLSFDIETDASAGKLLAISLYGCGTNEVLVVDPDSRLLPAGARGFPTERSAIEAFCKRVRAADPDILTGWNVIDFDLTVLARIAARCGLPLDPGRDAGGMRIRPAQGYFGSGSANIPGRLVLDGIDLLRGAFIRMEDYSLDAVARKVLGEGKAVAGDVHDRVGEIQRNYRHDLGAFVHYAATDARLALDILDSLKLIDLAVARSRLTGMTPDRVAASIASFDFLYLSALSKRKVVAPSVRSLDASVSTAAQSGGHVLEPRVGRHSNVWVFDFKSLYPSIIRTLNIDPLGYHETNSGDPELIVTVSGACFSREPGILPRLLDTLFPRREAAKHAGDQVASQAIKILMNSFYGVLGTPACRFYNPAIANAITGQGKHFLLWAKRWFEARGHQVLYGDTDSLFVTPGSGELGELREQGASLAEQLSMDISSYVESRWQVPCRLELEFEKVYSELFLPAVRGGAGGARKRYAGRLDTGKIEFVGMEVVRRDWTDLARNVQRELYVRLFKGEPVERFLAGMVKHVREGTMDKDLVYHKGLRKRLDSYTASTPPHVAAARKSARPPGRVVSYVITVDGPEPVDNIQHEIDREHYIDKQIRPVAEPVLGALGLEFDQVIGDDRQISLF
ncbi:DNA polymerase II [Pseudomonadota bacterium]